MKKTLIALAVLAVSGAAFAQSTATISGSISVGVMDTGLAGAKMGVASLGGGANAINIVTAEDLGGGMRAGFDSQMRFSAATGDRNSAGTGAALFHGANAYISGGMGTIRVGKIIEANNCAFDPWACTGGAGTNAGAPGTITGLIAAQTTAQSVSYATPTVGGFSASYHTSVSTRNNERSVINLSYSQGPLLAQFLQSKNSVNISGTDAGAASITDAPAQGTSMGARYNFGFATLSAFNAKTENAAGTVTADITAFTATVPMGAYTLLASSAKNKKAAATADTKTAVGINYALSKRTTVGADMFKQDAVGSSTGFVARVRHNF
jgi:predicted porin